MYCESSGTDCGFIQCHHVQHLPVKFIFYPKDVLTGKRLKELDTRFVDAIAGTRDNLD